MGFSAEGTWGLVPQTSPEAPAAAKFQNRLFEKSGCDVPSMRTRRPWNSVNTELYQRQKFARRMLWASLPDPVVPAPMNVALCTV